MNWLCASPFPPPAFTGFFGTMNWSDFLYALWLPRISSMLVPILLYLNCVQFCRTYRTSSVFPLHFSCCLAKLSDPGRIAFSSPFRLTRYCLLPNRRYRLLRFYNNFVALSLQRFRFRLGNLPVLRLSLSLPFRLQRLGTGCWLDFAGRGFPAMFSETYKWYATYQVECSQAICSLHSQLAPFFLLYHNFKFLLLYFCEYVIIIITKR